MPRKNHPPTGTQKRLLKEGFWETTAVCVDAEGREVVRKANKPGGNPGPWALKALREEIRYLAECPPGFPPLLCHWDITDQDGVHVGFEIPFYAQHESVSDYHTAHRLDQAQADLLQTHLATLLFEHLHQPNDAPTEVMSDHLRRVFASTADQLSQNPQFAPLVHADNVRINGAVCPGLQPLIAAPSFSQLCDRLDAQPVVRLHGDLILENILCHRAHPLDHPLVLIDPVSVVGISHGPALLDLIK